MAVRIEDYALIGDTETAALVGRDGSIDWMCVPRFDSGACFAALLGDAGHGRWSIAPCEPPASPVERRYLPGSLVLETSFRNSQGRVRLIDCMPPRDRIPDVVRIVEGVEGEVRLRMELVIRFDYGSIVPWMRRLPDGRRLAIAGADALVLQSGVEPHGEGLATVAEFVVRPGERVPFVLAWHPSHEPPPARMDAESALRDTLLWWQRWSRRCSYRGPWREAVLSSLITLKALTYEPTGGIVAAATTSLPEMPGGVRNWDYRYCWLRDATFTLYALTSAGYHAEARAWREWLLRAVAGDPAKLQIMYGLAGERRLSEYEIEWLPGYEGARPVRVGNSAAHQLQLDVYGEVMDALHPALDPAQRRQQPHEPAAWDLQRALLDYLEGGWAQPDEGLWEVRGPRQQFTHSKVMAWVAFDRAIQAVESAGLPGPVERWRELRAQIHEQVCERAWNSEKRAFTQAYGSTHLDASLLLLPQVGFLPASDPRMVSTVAAIERELLRDGLVQRYVTAGQDGLPPGEGVFLACSFWLADCYALLQRTDDARRLFERLLELRNDVGLLAEQYDPVSGRQLGNFPQAFSHVGLINTAFNLSQQQAQPARQRQRS
ncbi:MAG TPA: glycoside hydrolase family 15 protein [Polyangiaceae bacterium]|nr:glycoside hydrolase family 15 protein [Polyangiaceae bacterium]